MSVNQTSPNLAQSPLLATRFLVPRSPAAYISRPRLMDRLNQGLQTPVTLVSAPPGFGKSTLLSDWIKSRVDLHAARLSLETSDHDWELFFRYLITAWQQILPNAGGAALAEVNALTSSNHFALTNLLLNDLLAGQDAAGGERMRELLDEFRVLFPQAQLSDFVAEILAIFPAFSGAQSNHPIHPEALFEPLSGRELEILRLVSQGLSNSEIAARLVLAVGTVKTHIHTIYGKLGVRDRPQAIAKAGLLGL